MKIFLILNFLIFLKNPVYILRFSLVKRSFRKKNTPLPPIDLYINKIKMPGSYHFIRGINRALLICPILFSEFRGLLLSSALLLSRIHRVLIICTHRS